MMIIIFFVSIPTGLIMLNDSFNLPIYDNLIFKVFGLLLIVCELVIFIYCSEIFIKYGRGTPLITEPTNKFVEKGLYKYMRNPIYMGHMLYFFGLFLFFGRILLLVYFLFIFGLVHSIVVYLEEPHLKKKFGQRYIKYTRSVPRWIPKIC